MGRVAADRPRARDLVLAHGWNSTCYQILNPGMLLWFSDEHDAVVGYVEVSRHRVAGGAPVCPAEHIAAVAREFERDARAAGCSVVYFGAEARLDETYAAAATHSSILLGAQPSWHPRSWDARTAPRKSLRAQFNRARNKGTTVTLWSSAVAEKDARLRVVLKQWLATRGLPAMHFLVEPDTLDNLGDRLVFVAERNGDPVGFLIASPIPARRGWLTEQFVRSPSAPNGTAELMIDTAVRHMSEMDAEYVTLGLAPLSRLVERAPPMQWWLRASFAWLRAHGRRFYNFGGLEAFKAKFAPEAWEPVFAIANEPRFSPSSAYAIGAAFTSGAPIATAIHGAGLAFRNEVERLRAR